MAVKLNASATDTYLYYDDPGSDPFVPAGSGDNATPWGLCAWIRRDTDNGSNDEWPICVVQNYAGSSSTPQRSVTYENATGYLRFYDPDGYKNSSYVLNTDAWTFVAIASGATVFTAAKYYYGTTSPLTSINGSTGSIVTLPDFILGRYITGGTARWCRHSIAYLRLWQGIAPTKENFESEMVSATPATNLGYLWADYRFGSGSLLTNTEGTSSRNLVAGGTGGADDYAFVDDPFGASSSSVAPLAASYYAQLRA